MFIYTQTYNEAVNISTLWSLLHMQMTMNASPTLVSMAAVQI